MAEFVIEFCCRIFGFGKVEEGFLDLSDQVLRITATHETAIGYPIHQVLKYLEINKILKKHTNSSSKSLPNSEQLDKGILNLFYLA